jgi:ubiquinone/menaquinone biosynthesis C-methylase UbiE
MRSSSPTSRWYDGRFYAAVVDRLLEGVHGYVAAHLPDGQRVLDAACGTGALSQQIARTGRQVVGIDMSPRHIDHARRRAAQAGFAPDRLRFEVGDLRELERDDAEPFDVAVIVLALHEMPHTTAREVLARLAVVASRVMVVDFAAPLAWNVPGLTKRAAEVAAGRSHHAAFRAYQANGGLDTLLAETGVTAVADRTIDSGTLRVVTARASHGQS